MRRLRGWNLRQLEKESGVSNAYISQLESGAQTNPTIDIIVKLAGALKTTPSRLLEEVEISEKLEKMK
jgi:transcriptional regulator with XRE-family HTH domain